MAGRWKGSLVIACALLICFAPEAHACRCRFGGGPPCEEFWRADAVFAGRVDEISFTTAQEQDAYLRNIPLIRFSIETAFRGLEGSRVEVLTGRGDGDCGYGFKKSERYLVYAHRSRDGRLFAGICSRARPLSEAAEDLDYIRHLPPAGVGATIRGQVMLDSRGLDDHAWLIMKPMEQARIIINGGGKDLEVTTDEGGRFKLAGLLPGTYKVRVDLPSHLDGYTEAEVEIADRACADLDFRVNLNGRLSGRVLGSDDQPIRSVKVDIIPAAEADAASPIGKSRFTNEEGAFQFDWLPPGIYLLGVNLTGAANTRCPFPRTYFPGVDNPARAEKSARLRAQLPLKRHPIQLQNSLRRGFRL